MVARQTDAMDKVIVDIGQNLCDISIQETGSMDNVVEIAEANGLDIMDDLRPGSELIIPDSCSINKPILSYLKSKKVTVTSQL